MIGGLIYMRTEQFIATVNPIVQSYFSPMQIQLMERIGNGMTLKGAALD